MAQQTTVSAVKDKAVRIGKNVRVFSTKAQLISCVKQKIPSMISSVEMGMDSVSMAALLHQIQGKVGVFVNMTCFPPT
jgi:hypothetical protein